MDSYATAHNTKRLVPQNDVAVLGAVKRRSKSYKITKGINGGKTSDLICESVEECDTVSLLSAKDSSVCSF